MDSFLLWFLFTLILLLLSHRYAYFWLRGIPYLTPLPLVGHLWFFTLSQMEIACFLYNSFPGERFFGFFQTVVPTLVVKDPELVHQILVKDFNHFYDRGFPVIDGDTMTSRTLFHLRGQHWRSLRNKLTPTFSSGKIKLMFDQFLKSGDNMLKNIDQKVGEAVDAKLIIVEFGTEVIASTAFGINFSKDNSQTQEFIKRVSLAFHMGFRLNLLLQLATVMPNMLNQLGISMFTPGTMDYFMNLTKATKQFRKRNNIKRNDYFDLLLTLQENEENGKSIGLPTTEDAEDSLIDQMEHAPELTTMAKRENIMLTDEVMTAQTFIFLLAGSESISLTLSFMLYHVARNPEIQTKLLEEINNSIAKHGGWTYQGIKELAYLDQVMQETLRLYPMVPFLRRECTLKYQIPDSNVVIDKGTKVYIPISGIHMDPKFYPNPEEFRPERFSNNNHKPSSIYMPFGDGPRICIAMRFAIVEVKVCLAKILSRYKITVNSKTQEPLVMDVKSFSPKPIGGIWITLQRR